MFIAYIDSMKNIIASIALALITNAAHANVLVEESVEMFNNFAAEVELFDLDYTQIPMPVVVFAENDPNLEDRIAYFNTETDEIVLPADIDLSDIESLAIFYHEYVHYLQEIAEVEHRCSGMYEAEAYAEEIRFLRVFSDLTEEELRVIRITAMMQSMCGPAYTQ